MQEEYTTKQLAARFQVTPRTVQRWITSGALPAETIRRGHFLIEAETLTNWHMPHEEGHQQPQETTVEALQHRLLALEKRLYRLEHRKIVIRLLLKK